MDRPKLRERIAIEMNLYYQPAILFAFLTFNALATPLPSAAHGETPPNIILILADDLSANVLPSYGGESVSTPVLDRLAAAGMRYTHCYSTQLCMPSRCELLTGKYSHRNFLGRGNIQPGEATIASELRSAGYATCQIEKWHLNINRGAMPPQVGFDEYYHTKLAHNYFDPVVDINGIEKSFPGEYGPKVCQRLAFDFINRNRRRPFFLFYAMHLPHAPFHVPPGSHLDDNSSISEKYHAMVEHQDTLVGELVRYLDSLELQERTLLLFTGDNGTPHGIHYLADGRSREGGKGSLLDSGTHVPLIAHWPGVAPKGVVTDALVDFADFLPTLMLIAGSQPTSKMKFDGQSFHRQLLGDTDAPARDFAFKFGCKNGGQGAGPVHGYWARTQRWKLYDDGRFYDVREDGDESDPLDPNVMDKQANATHQALQQVLSRSGAEIATKQFRRRSD